jgi:hypothetical protein
MSRYKKQACVCGHSKTIHTPINDLGKRACARLACNCGDYRSVPAVQGRKGPPLAPPSRSWIGQL